jgi:hypothetical protein
MHDAKATERSTRAALPNLSRPGNPFHGNIYSREPPYKSILEWLCHFSLLWFRKWFQVITNATKAIFNFWLFFDLRHWTRVTNRPDFFRSALILSFLCGIKWTLIPDGKKSENSTTFETSLNISHYNFMWYTTFKYKYKAIAIGSLLLCKIQLVPLVLVPSFLKIYANQIVSMFMDLYRR